MRRVFVFCTFQCRISALGGPIIAVEKYVLQFHIAESINALKCAASRVFRRSSGSRVFSRVCMNYRQSVQGNGTCDLHSTG